MKKSISNLMTSAVLAGVIFISCNTSSQRVENAETNVQEAADDLEKANQEYLTDIEKYKIEAAEKIAANNQRVMEFNARIEKEKKEVRADYRKKISELEKKNSDMKMKIDNYKAEGKEKWIAFKKEFTREVDELGKAFNELTGNNAKQK